MRVRFVVERNKLVHEQMGALKLILLATEQEVLFSEVTLIRDRLSE